MSQSGSDDILGSPHPSGVRTKPPTPLAPLLADTVEDKLEVVADGRAIAPVPANDRHLNLRDDLVTVAVEGIEPCQVVVATRRDDTNSLVIHFRQAAKTHLTFD